MLLIIISMHDIKLAMKIFRDKKLHKKLHNNRKQKIQLNRRMNLAGYDENY